MEGGWILKAFFSDELRIAECNKQYHVSQHHALCEDYVTGQFCTE